MTYSLMKVSLSYFRGRSSGVVLDKYAVDLAILDSTVGHHIEQQLTVVFNCLSSFIYLIIYKPILIVLLTALVVFTYGVHAYCVPAVIAQR